MKNVLLIDSSSIVKSVIKKLFNYDKNLLIYEASTLEESKKELEKNDFFVVVTNLALPDADRFQILDFLKKMEVFIG